MQRIALFPGTFDPITIGHLDIISRSLPLFDKLYIGIGRNANKEPMFSEEQRLTWIKQIFKDNPKVDALLDAADVEADGPKRLKLYQEAEALIVADAPVVPLYYPLKVQMHAERVLNYKLHPIWGVELAGVEVK